MRSYYLVPTDDVGNEAFAVIREAMREEGLAGIGRVVLYRRERLLMLSPHGKGILGTTLRYTNEVRDEHKYFDDIKSVKIPKDMLDLAKHILESRETKFDPAKFEDRYETALKKLIAAKKAGKPPPAPPPQPSNVINLMEALRRSAAGARGHSSGRGGRTRAHRTSRRAGAKRLKRAS